MSLSNRCGVTPRVRGTTTAPGALEGTQVGTLEGSAVRAAFNNANMVPRQQIIDLLDQSATLLPGNICPQITPEGGRASRESTENHPSGWAADIQLVRQGTVLTPVDSPDLYVTFISGLVGNSILNNRVAGVGLYNWGIHIDQTESRQTGRGDIASWNGWPRGSSSAGPQEVLDAGVSAGRQRAANRQFAGAGTTPNDGSSGSAVPIDGFPALADPSGSLLADIESQRQTQTVCDNDAPFNRNGGGCGALGGFSFASLASIAGGFGLGIPTSLTSATSLFTGSLPISLNSSIIDIVGSGTDFLNVAGITDISAFTNDMLNVGAGSTLNSLTGKMTGSVAQIINGGVNNLISAPINEIASNVFGNGDLSKFTNIFNNVLGATGASGGLASGLTQLQGQVFGNAFDIIGQTGIDPFTNVAGLDINSIAGGKFQSLIGDPSNVLPKIIGGGAALALNGGSVTDVLQDAVGGIVGDAVDGIVGGNFQSLIGNPSDILTQVIGGGSVTDVLQDAVGGIVGDAVQGGATSIIQNVAGSVVGDRPLAMFGTAYRDMNAMVTQGFGSLTEDLPALGLDLSSLGKLGNMQDLLRIGTPGQIIEQIAISGGAAVSAKIVPSLISKGLSIANINRPENDNAAREILAEVTESDLIVDTFEKMDIQRVPDVPSLAVLEDPEWLFPNSKESNRFNNLNEASVHLSILDCGKLKDTQELGNLLTEMESISAESELLNEIQPLQIEENMRLKDLYVPTSEYSGDGDLTVADFIGTAAGYRVTETLPLMRQYTDELVEEGVLTCYTDLLELLRDTLSGDHTFSSTRVSSGNPGEYVDLPAGVYLTEILPPDAVYEDVSNGNSLNDDPLVFCGRYSFGYYASLELACYAIKDAIEDELEYIYDNATGETLEKLKRLQAAHDETNHQLYKEQKLRKNYGIDIGFSKTGSELKTGDGSTTTFDVTGNPDTENDPNMTVYVAGLKLTSAQFTYNATTKIIETVTAPGSGEAVEIAYDTGHLDVQGNLRDIWNFSNNLENFGVATGFGREAEFLSRVITDDVHGTRIKSAMMQARNRERASAYGLECPGYNRVLSDFNDNNPNGISTFTEETGIWSNDVERASELYIQNNTDFDSREEYVAYQIKKNKTRQQENFDDIMSTILGKLIFYSGGYIAISNTLADMYNQYKMDFRNRKLDNNNVFKVSLTEDQPSEGFIIGPYKQIISAILREESINDFIFNVPLTEQSNVYLESIGIDINTLSQLIQKILIVNAGKYLGLAEEDVKNIFSVPSTGKYLVKNIADQL